jgi:hypothetical protein
MVSLDSAKIYLRVDSADEDELIGLLLLTRKLRAEKSTFTAF